MISERTKAALKAAKARGTKLGNPGIRDVGEKGRAASLAAADRFAERIWPVIESMREEGINLSEIARELNERGTKTRTGRAWTAQTVKNVILWSCPTAPPNIVGN